jgi:membrane protein DedA with SNARE-associated domain
LTHLILEYRYWILLPLSFVEGPIVAFVAGTLAAAGYFSVAVLALFFFCRDILVDLTCYSAGYLGGHTRWLRRVLARFGVAEAELQEVRALWHTHPGKTMFLSKLAYGVAGGFMMVAGLVRMPLPTFVAYGSAIAVVHYGVLLAAGYFFGASFGGTIVGLMQRLSQALLVFAVLAIGYYLLKRRIGRTLHEEEEKAGRPA